MVKLHQVIVDSPMQTPHPFRKSAFFLPLASSFFAVTVAAADCFPSVPGVWAGSYKVAFPAKHPTDPDQSVQT